MPGGLQSWASLCLAAAITIHFPPPVLVCLQVILTNQITTALSSGPGPRADLVSPADDLSLSEGKESLPSELKLYTATNPHCNLQSSVEI